jgi:hypothetical protein
MARNWYGSVVPEDAAPAPCEIDVSVARPARVHDYWLGGKDNFAAGRAAAKRVLKARPGIRANVRASRRFLARAVRFLAAGAGVQQFLDIGTGIPTTNTTHEVTQAVRPEARVTCVDNDPGRAGARAGPADRRRRPGHVRRRRPAGRRHDLVPGGRDAERQPAVAAMLIAVLRLIPVEDDPWRIVASFRDTVPSGRPPGAVPPVPRRGGRPVRQGGRPPRPARSGPGAPACRDELARFPDGVEIAGSGLVQMHRRRSKASDPVARSSGCAVVARNLDSLKCPM